MWDDPASRALIDTLRLMRARAGAPSLRAITARIAERGVTHMSHTTVASLLNGTAIPSWEHVQAVVNALGGQPENVRELWAQSQLTRMNTDRPPQLEYTQFTCPVAGVADAYTERAEHGWEPLHVFASPYTSSAVELVMRRTARPDPEDSA
jgi:hypothetical protein